jgi:hypothetical protein
MFCALPHYGVLSDDDPFQFHSDREALELHAEILALQSRLGISYKDAAHRLYSAEMAKLAAEQQALRGIESIRDRIDNSITHEIYPAINYIDEA